MPSDRASTISPASFVEAALPMAVAAGGVIGAALLAGAQATGPVGYGLLLAGAAALLFRRQHPVTVLWVTVVVAFAYNLLNFPGGLCAIAIGVALYSVADAGHRRAGLLAISVVGLGFLAIGVFLGRGHITELTTALWFGGWLVASFVLGETTRSRREYLAQVEERALAAERSREEEALRRAGEERIRIARELHDILAHRISMISVQSGVGAHLMERRPEEARRALLAINEASKEALQELRATLGVLRQVDEPDPRAPAPGLAQLTGVIASTTAAGVDVRLDVSGDPRDLPAGVDLAAYRIIQESLTNVVRHARAATARIGIAYRRSDVLIEIEDDGRGTAEPGRETPGGNGMLGMRERATALGGELEAGPQAGGGFLVTARLPLDGAA